jgi:hypothetical protein
VIQDIRGLGMKYWMNVAMNKEDWLKLLKKARVHRTVKLMMIMNRNN